MVLDQFEGDLTPLGRAWTAIDHRLDDLRDRIEETWLEQVSDLFEDEAARHRAEEQGKQVAARLRVDYKRGYTRAFGEAGRRIGARAAELRVLETRCMRCGSAHCPSCQATATFQPSTFEYQLEAAAEYVADDVAFDAYRAMRAASGTPEHRAANLAYWRVYLTAIADVLPERAATLEADLAAKG